MNEIILIGEKQVSPIEYQGERVVTLRMVDELHQRPDGTAGRNFRRHRGRMLEGVEYWEVPYDEFSAWESVPTNFVATERRAPIILLSESGYLMLVKSFQDDLAWEVQRALVQHYFRSKSLSSPNETRLLRMIGSEIATGIREGLDSGLKPITSRLDCVEERLGSVEGKLDSVVRRQELTSATKRQHIDTMMFLGGKCPCCHQRDVIDQYGNKMADANWDHWYAPHRRAPHETWLVCSECNQALKIPKVRHHRQIAFDAYQVTRDEKHRPMFRLFDEVI